MRLKQVDSHIFRKQSGQGGATLVELALITPVFLMLIIGIIELSMAYFANMTMQHAVREGARYAVTGGKDLDPDSATMISTWPLCRLCGMRIRIPSSN